MCSPDLREGELAIVVGDPWQGKGVAAELFRDGFPIAKEHGIKSVWAMALPENKTVLVYAGSLGFSVRWNAEARAYDLRKDFR
jgi:acetyltransferase